MKRENWSTATFYGVVKPGELQPEELRWLCGCGRTKSFKRSKAYPICRCKRRMRMLDHPKLGYAPRSPAMSIEYGLELADALEANNVQRVKARTAQRKRNTSSSPGGVRTPARPRSLPSGPALNGTGLALSLLLLGVGVAILSALGLVFLVGELLAKAARLLKSD